MKSNRMNPNGLRVTVPCRNATHTVCFNAKGQLGMLDHTPADLAKEIAWEDMGGEPCGCRALLSNWRKSLQWTQKWKKVLPPDLFPFREDCVAEHDRRWQAKSKEYRLERLNPHIPVYRRVGFLERLLNHLLIARLGLPRRQWLSLEYRDKGWFPLTLHYPYPEKASRSTGMGVQRDYVRRIYQEGLALYGDALTVYLRGEWSGHGEAVQLIPVQHKKVGLCLRRRVVNLPTYPDNFSYSDQP